MTETSIKSVAFQGLPGAYSDLACKKVFPDRDTLPCSSFEETFAAVHEGRAELSMIPVENSVFGRVADIHYLLPNGGLHIIGEHFQPVHHCLLAVPGTRLENIKRVYSHPQALGQCRNHINDLGLEPHAEIDTAGAAQIIAARGNPEEAALASYLAAEKYGLQVLREHMEDQVSNTTRFLIMAREPLELEHLNEKDLMTTFVFRVRNIPAALYKAMGGFATNGINMTKLESYMLGGSFAATQFYSDVEGHPGQKAFRLAMEELGFFARDVKVLGVYAASPLRREQPAQPGDD